MSDNQQKELGNLPNKPVELTPEEVAALQAPPLSGANQLKSLTDANRAMQAMVDELVADLTAARKKIEVLESDATKALILKGGRYDAVVADRDSQIAKLQEQIKDERRKVMTQHEGAALRQAADIAKLRAERDAALEQVASVTTDGESAFEIDSKMLVIKGSDLKELIKLRNDGWVVVWENTYHQEGVELHRVRLEKRTPKAVAQPDPAEAVVGKEAKIEAFASHIEGMEQLANGVKEPAPTMTVTVLDERETYKSPFARDYTPPADKRVQKAS